MNLPSLQTHWKCFFLLLPKPIISIYIIALHKSALHYRWWCVCSSPTWGYIPCLSLKSVFHLKWFLLMSITAKCNSHSAVFTIVNFFWVPDAFEHLFFLKLSSLLVCYYILLSFILWFLYQLTKTMMSPRFSSLIFSHWQSSQTILFPAKNFYHRHW